jgi:uncharacterized membrane protein
MSFKKNIVNILLILLLLGNIVTLGLVWFRTMRPPAPPDQAAAIDFLSKELRFDAKQQKALKQLMQQHRDETKEIRNQVKEAKDHFFDLLNDDNISDSAIEKASYAAVDAQRQMDVRVFKHFKRIKALCNDEQKKRFNEIIKDAIHRMARPAEGRPAGPPPEGAERPDEPPPPRS